VEPTLESTIDEAREAPEPRSGTRSGTRSGARSRTAADRLTSRRLLVKTLTPEDGDDGAHASARASSEWRDTNRSERPRDAFWRDWRVQALVAALALAVGLLTWRLSEAAPVAVDFEARLGSALIAVESGRREEGMSKLEGIARDSRAPVVALTALARLVLEDGDLPRARRLLERAVLRSPGTAELQIWLGLLAFEDGDVEGARRALEGAKKMRASDAAVRGLEALVSGQRGTAP